MFKNPSEQEQARFFANLKRIAVVGLSPQPARPSYRVSAKMQQWGFQIVPVRPLVQSVLGETAYASLADVPGKIDLVNIFRRAEELDALVDQCIALEIPAIWIQLGIVNESAAQRARDAGIFVVMDRCIMVEYARLHA